MRKKNKNSERLSTTEADLICQRGGRGNTRQF